MTIISRAIRNASAMMRAGEWGTAHVIPPPSQAGALGSAGGEGAALGIATVLSCLKALSDDLTSVPFSAYVGDRDGARTPAPRQPRIVAEPFGPDTPPEEGFGQLFVSRGMRGAGYAFVASRDRSTGLPDQLIVLHPDAVHPKWKNGAKVFVIGNTSYGPDEIIQINGLMMPGAPAGVDVLTAQRVNFELAMQVGEYAQGFFGNGGSPAGVISVPGSGDRKKAREVKAGWESDHGGVPNAHRPAVLFGGAKWEPLSVTPENAQFLETRRYLRDELAALFGVSIGRLDGGKEGTYDADHYRIHGLLPPARSIERVWDRLLPGGDGSWTLFGLDVFTRATPEVRAKVAQVDRVIGVRTIDEVRAERGLAPLPDGQGANPFTPLNSNTSSPTGGEDNESKPGGQPGPADGGPSA